MTAHAWRETGRELLALGGYRARPVYACDRCGAESITGYESELEKAPGLRLQDPEDRSRRIRVRVTGHSRTGQKVPEDCDEELTRRVMES